MGFETIREKISSVRIKSDKVIWILVVIFAMVSVLAIFSASSYLEMAGKMSKIEAFSKQLKFAFGGFAVLLLCYFIPLKWYRSLAIVVYAASLALLVFAIFKGKNVNGAQRTVEIFGISFQVLEFAKVGLIFYLAKALELWKDSLGTVKDYILKLLLPIGATCCLVLPNSASSVIMFGGISMLILFLMDVNWRYILVTIVAAATGILILVGIYNLEFKGKKLNDDVLIEKVFRRFETSGNRVRNFIKYDLLEEKVDRKSMSNGEYQEALKDIGQSQAAKVAIFDGGIIGKGPGRGTSRYNLPEGYSDLIYAVIVNEYGLAGGVVLIFLYFLFLFRGIRIAQKCSTPFPQALALGISWLVGIQAMMHIFVSVRLLPITGHTLPFISQGGTAFLIFCGCTGVLLSVSKQINRQNEAAAAAKEATTEQNEEIESDN